MIEGTRLRQIGAGLAALGGLALLLVGVPLALSKLAGWPLPAGVPAWNEIRYALGRSEIPDSTLIKTMAVIGWLAWAQIAVSTVLEVGVWVRGRPAPRLPSAGMVQPTIRRLVATAALLISTSTSNLSVASAMTAPTPIVTVVDQATDFSAAFTSSLPAAAPGSTITQERAAPTYVVQRRDTLWGLAESHLSDPFRWRDIFELNQGVEQADGGVLVDPDLIRTGWVLTFPSDAIGLVTGAAPTTPTVEPTTPPPAEPPTPPAPAAPADSREPHAPGDVTTVATTTTPAPASTSSSTPSTTAAGQTSANAPAADTPRPEDGPTWRVPLPIVGGGLLAASLLVLLSRLRQVRQRRRKPGQRARRPRPDLAPLETAIRIAADLDDASLLDLGLRAFLAGITPYASKESLAIQAVRILDGRLEILLDRPLPTTPDGFEDLGERRAWQTERSLTGERLIRLAAESPAALPALVSFGEADGGELLIDLEAAGVLGVDGPAERTRAFIRRLATELATSTWADHLDVLTADPRQGDLTGTQRVRNVPTVDDAIDELAAAGRVISIALAAASCANTLAGRASGVFTADWTPTVFVHAEPLEAEQIDRLRDVVRQGGRGVAAVVPADGATCEWAIDLSVALATVKPLGIVVVPHVLDAAVADAIDELLTDTAIDDPPIEADEPEPLRVEPPSPPPVESVQLVSGPYEDPPFDVEVRVLGEVEVSGATFDRRRVVELITYLALHPGGISDDRLKTALWPERAPSTATFNTTVSQARNGLGRRPEDMLRFPHFAATGNLYRLDPSVTCDALRFENRVNHARRSEPSDAVETLRSALELVRGMPFMVHSGYEWAHTEGLIACYEAMIGDAAHRLAAMYLEARDIEAATWAAMQGLKASPGNEVLYRDRMLACHLTGNPAGIKTILNELCEVVEANEPYDSLHPETLALYERLHNGSRRTRPSEAE